jgi:hypothetical protein
MCLLNTHQRTLPERKLPLWPTRKKVRHLLATAARFERLVLSPKDLAIVTLLGLLRRHNGLANWHLFHLRRISHAHCMKTIGARR